MDFSSLLAFTGVSAPIGFARGRDAKVPRERGLLGAGTRWEFVMRNRSATVADFHGLPWFTEMDKERKRLGHHTANPSIARQKHIIISAFNDA
jgi:hypothetical protein